MLPPCRRFEYTVGTSLQPDKGLIARGFAEVGGDVIVEISCNDGTDYTQSGLKFTYEGDAKVFSISPTDIPAHGGTTISVNGVNFTSTHDLSCAFGKSLRVPAQYVSSELLVCTAPPLPERIASAVAYTQPLSLSLEVYSSTHAFTSDFVQVHYRAIPTLTAIEPSSIPEGNAFEVIVYGENFPETRGLHRRFGASGSVPASWISQYEIRCLAPSNHPGKVQVYVTINGMDYVEESLTLEYRPAKTIVSIHPESGPVDGGTAVTVSGTGFQYGRMPNDNHFKSSSARSSMLRTRSSSSSSLWFATWFRKWPR